MSTSGLTFQFQIPSLLQKKQKQPLYEFCYIQLIIYQQILV